MVGPEAASMSLLHALLNMMLLLTRVYCVFKLLLSDHKSFRMPNLKKGMEISQVHS